MLWINLAGDSDKWWAFERDNKPLGYKNSGVYLY